MIEIGKVVAGSNWDDGIHLGFFCGVAEKNQHSLKSLNWYLTREQITLLESLIATCVSSFLNAEEKNQ
jgi:mannitol/fructose-specific phosphotransferase system IIA component